MCSSVEPVAETVVVAVVAEVELTPAAAAAVEVTVEAAADIVCTRPLPQSSYPRRDLVVGHVPASVCRSCD